MSRLRKVKLSCLVLYSKYSKIFLLSKINDEKYNEIKKLLIIHKNKIFADRKISGDLVYLPLFKKPRIGVGSSKVTDKCLFARLTSHLSEIEDIEIINDYDNLRYEFFVKVKNIIFARAFHRLLFLGCRNGNGNRNR